MIARPTVGHSKLPEDVLLEIFDAYRQLFHTYPWYDWDECRHCYENIWNSRNGWFKLTHVCRSWRRLVHSSPSRLDVHLLYTPCKSSKDTMLRHLPPLPILFDYNELSCLEEELNPELAAIMHHTSCVRGITLPVLETPWKTQILMALCRPFPKLESLDISPEYGYELILPPTILSGSAPCLRRLTLQLVVSSCLSPLLSFTTGLVELSLTLIIDCIVLAEPSFLANLQRMSRLRRLELGVHSRCACCNCQPPAVTGSAVPLSKLTHFIFTGHGPYLEAFIVGLAAPSLQHFKAVLDSAFFRPHIFPIPHLYRFICDTGCQFTAVRLSFGRSLRLEFHMGTDSELVNDHQPFTITLPWYVPLDLEQMSQELSGPFSTVEGFIITQDDPSDHKGQALYVPKIQWRGCLYHLPQVKTIWVPATMAISLVRSFQLDGLQPVLDLLPALERVEVSPVEVSSVEVGKDELESAFEPLISARQRAGRPIKVIMNWS
jgi:hypothetical protein